MFTTNMQKPWAISRATRTIEGATARIFASIPPTPLVLAAVISIQIGSALASFLFSSMGPVGTVFVSTTFAATFLMLAARPITVPRTTRQLRTLLMYGLVLMSMELPFFLSLQYIPLGVAATITFVGPLALAVATSRRWEHYACISVAAVGIFLFMPDMTSDLHLEGLALALFSSIAWAAFIPMSKRAGSMFPRGVGLALGLSVSAGLMLPVALFEQEIWNSSTLDLVAAFVVALLTTIFPLAAEFRALQTMSARLYGILMTLEPAAAALIGYIFLAQVMTVTMVAAILCVTAAAIAIVFLDQRDGLT